MEETRGCYIQTYPKRRGRLNGQTVQHTYRAGVPTMSILRALPLMLNLMLLTKMRRRMRPAVKGRRIIRLYRFFARIRKPIHIVSVHM